MFLDTSFNSPHTVLSNIHTAFIESATKMYTYIRCLPTRKQPSNSLITRTLKDLINLAFVSMRHKPNGAEGAKDSYRCDVTREQVEFLGLSGFREVLGRKMGRYKSVVGWVDERLGVVGKGGMQRRMQRRMRGVVRGKGGRGGS